jgi:polysaccharide export outer membrane protein
MVLALLAFSVHAAEPAAVAPIAAVREPSAAYLVVGLLVNPVVTVSVATFRSQPVQVLGAVAKPGVYYLRGPTTVMQILGEAGGAANAGVDEVRLTRGGRPDEVVAIPYEELLRQGGTPTLLGSGDIVFVPQVLVLVSGLVEKPGEIPFREGMTLTPVITAAGGAAPRAALSAVVILRGDERLRANVRRILAGKDPDVVLRAGDRVHARQSAS